MRGQEIDWKADKWDVPGERMKMKRDHVVPLPTQAIEVLRNPQEFDFGSELAFPSPRDISRTMSEMTFNSARCRMGQMPDRHALHDREILFPVSAKHRPAGSFSMRHGLLSVLS